MNESTIPSLAETIAALGPLVAAVQDSSPSRAADCLRNLPAPVRARLPEAWLGLTIHALESGTYEALAAPFARLELFGPHGQFLIVAPYTRRRSAGDVTALSLLFGDLLPHTPTPGLGVAIEAIQGRALAQRVTPLYPFRPLVAAGTVDGLAFVVPGGWCWRASADGPALTDVFTEVKRFELAGRRCIQRIFDEATAAAILAPLDDGGDTTDVHVRSYEIHDAGHCSGLGLTRKYNDGLLPGWWYCGVEEWRADGIGFELGARLLSPAAAAADIASNYYVRFGQIAPLSDGPDGPTEHTGCTLLMLDVLLREGNLVARGDRLCLRDPGPEGLVRSMEPHRQDAIALTRRELDLTQSFGLMRLYGTRSLHPSTVAIFENMVRLPCKGFYDVLS